MKRLLTFIGLLATLLAMPYHAKADTWAYYLHGSFDGWANEPSNDYKFGDTSNGSDQPSWTKTFTGAQLDTNNDGITYFRILCVKNGNTNIELGPLDNDQVLEQNGIAITMNKDAKYQAYKVTGINKDAKYTIKYVSSSREGGTISITGENTKIKLKGDYSNPKWGVSTNYTYFSDGIYTWEFTPTNFPNNTQFKLFDEGTNSWYGNDAVVTEDWSSAFSGEGDNNMSVSYTANDELIKISVQAKKSNGNWKIRIVKTYKPHDYYWVSPQVTRNEKWTYFKLVPSRNRSRNGGDGQISSKYYTFTIQDEFIKRFNGSDMPDDTQIQWYIVRDDGNVFYRPTSPLPVDDTPTKYDENHQGSGTLDSHVSFKNYWGEGYGDYKTTDTNRSGSFSFSKGSAKAYTFNLNAEKGHVFFNSTTASAATDIDYYLVGNFTSAKGEVDIPITDTSHPMTKWYYKGNEVTTDPVADADSIVYKVNVAKPAEGWGDLYIDINPSGNTDWNQAIRPLINLGNNLDGRALHGGLVVKNSDQSLNPETSANYLGYTFSFNATTFTYQLEFHMPDVTLSPGTEDGEHKFTNESRATIDVNFSEESAHASAATQYAITLSADENFTLDESTKYNNPTFELRYDGTNILKDGTIVASNSNTVYVKVRGYDDINQCGDIHTYQYTFYTPLSFEPRGGLFINSAKIKIEGGLAPYRYEIYNYGTKEEYGVEVIDIDPSKLVKSGTFDDVTYDPDDQYYRISTPGFLKITDANNSTVSYDVVGGGFDFTYSTSENYDINKNGADYWTAAPGDLSIKLDPKWGTTDGLEDEESTLDWAGNKPKKVNANQTLTQTIQGLNAGKTYTVQAIVGGKGEGKKTVTLTLEGAETVTKTINLRNGGSENSADLSRQGSEITRTGRVEYIEPSNLTGMNKYDGADAGGWAKVEATVNASQAGWLTISLTGDEWFDLSQVTLLEDANTTHGFRTTASATATEVGTGSGKPYDYRARNIQSGWKQNNAYSFFDRGKNRNAVIFANNRTVIAMDKSLLAPECPNRDIDRRHPFNVVGSDEDDSTDGVAKALYLTDMGYGSDENNPVDYKIGTKGADGFNSSGYKDSGYTFMPIYGFLAENVILDRTPGVSEKEQTTIMLPFAITVSELRQYYGKDLQVWDYTGFDLNTRKVSLTEVANNLIANKPYMLTGANGTLDSRNVAAYRNKERRIAPVSYTLHHSANTSHSGLSGTYEYITVSREDENNTETHYGFRATEGTFTIASESGAKLKPFRAYFTLPMSYAKLKEKLGIAESRTFSIVFDADATTGITQTEEVRLAPANVYNINGVLMNSVGNLEGLPKGIYIMNGKKFVVK